MHSARASISRSPCSKFPRAAATYSISCDLRTAGDLSIVMICDDHCLRQVKLHQDKRLPLATSVNHLFVLINLSIV